MRKDRFRPIYGLRYGQLSTTLDDNAFKIVLYEFQHGTINYDADHLETLFSIQFLTNILPSVILIVTLTLI